MKGINLKGKSGQAVLVLVMIMGAAVLGITTIAGFITIQKIRGATDIRDSVRSIDAADAGIECALYQKYGRSGGGDVAACGPTLTFSNQSLGETIPAASVDVQVDKTDYNIVKSIGSVGRVSRGFGLFFSELSR